MRSVVVMVFAFLFGFEVQHCAEPLPVGETGGANGKPLRGEPERKAVFALAKRPLLSGRKGLVVRWGQSPKPCLRKGASPDGRDCPLAGSVRVAHSTRPPLGRFAKKTARKNNLHLILLRTMVRYAID